MEAELARLKRALAEHPLYAEIHSVRALQLFMERHIVCVWDFMALVKSLQRDLTCVRVPWVPPPDQEAARLINEIVLDEETDALGEGRYPSHFDWYVEAMGEVGCDAGPVHRLVAELRRGIPVIRPTANATGPWPRDSSRGSTTVTRPAGVKPSAPPSRLSAHG